MESLPNYGIDPLLGSQIMNDLSLSPYDLEVPERLRKLKDCTDFFATVPNARTKILRLTAGKPGDKLDILWSYCELHKEKERRISNLNPKDFAEDIEKELINLEISQNQIKRVKNDLDTREKELKIRQDIESSRKFEIIRRNLDEVELINGVLAKYK